MTLTIACPNCQTPLAIPKEYEGKTGTCRRCGKPVKAIAENVVFTASDLDELEREDESQKPDANAHRGSLWWFKKRDDLMADWIPVDPNVPPPKYQRNQRVAQIRVFSQAGWIVGNVQAPHGTRLVDHLNQQREFIPMLDVFLEGRPKSLDSFALQKRAVYFLVATDVEDLRSAADFGNLRVVPISCLLPNGSMFASVQMPQDVSLPQFFAGHAGFVSLSDCHYRVRDPWAQQILDDTEPVVLLNTGSVIGLAERGTGGD